MLLEHAAVHDYLKACTHCPICCLLIYDPLMHPYHLCTNSDRIIHNGRDILRAPEDIDYIDIFRDRLLRGQVRIAKRFLKGLSLIMMPKAIWWVLTLIMPARKFSLKSLPFENCLLIFMRRPDESPLPVLVLPFSLHLYQK